LYVIILFLGSGRMAAMVAVYVISSHNGIGTETLTIFVLEVYLAIVRSV
jgi:hypothetical protein